MTQAMPGADVGWSSAKPSATAQPIHTSQGGEIRALAASPSEQGSTVVLDVTDLLAHELGTPLTLILGYLDLSTSGALGAHHIESRQASTWLSLAERLNIVYALILDAAKARGDEHDRFVADVEPLLVELNTLAAALSEEFAIWESRARGEVETKTASLCRAQAVRLMGLGSQITATGRLLAPSLTLVEQDVDLVRWLRSLIHELGPAIIGTGHRLRLDAPQGTLGVCVDEALLQLAVFNVVDNAQKFSAPGTCIQITVRRTGRLGAIEVADEGPGIPQGLVIRPFRRIDVLNDFLAPGVGVGLSIAERAVRLQRGQLSWASRPGAQGSLVTLMLPLRDADG